MGISNTSHLSTYFRVVAFTLSLYAFPVHAIDFFVDSTSDVVDAFPGDGTCATAGSACTLRAAIQEVTQGATSTTYNIYLPANTYILELNGAELIADAGDLNIDSSGSTILIAAQSGASAINVIIQSTTLTDRIFHIIDAANVTFRNVTIQDANTSVIGGAIYNDSGGVLTLDGVVLDNNATTAASGGGAIYNNSGTTSISDSTFSNNQASVGWGGAIYNASSSTLSVSSSTFSNNSADRAGGAIYHANTTASSLTISNSTFQSNSSSTSGGGLHNVGNASVNGSLFTQNNVLVDSGFGGGGITNNLVLTVKNSTISGNQTWAHGGGIYNGNSVSANLTLNNVTITGNTADLNSNSVGDGGGLYADTSTTVNYSNTIIANNTDASTEAPDCGGASITSQDNNIVEDTFGCTIGGTPASDQTGDPSLAVLADNGGPTLTHALNAGSIAIDAGNQNTPDGVAPNCETTDQRGYSRPVDGDSDSNSYCDIGAYELGATPPSTPISGGGCYIATAAYGTKMEKDVVTLRRFRDRYLLTNKPGKLFTDLYYKLSPPVASQISTSETLREWARASLIPLVSLGRLLDDADAKNN